MVKFLVLLWLQNDYDLPITRMDCLIDGISDKVIDNYVKRGLLEDILTNVEFVTCVISGGGSGEGNGGRLGLHVEISSDFNISINKGRCLIAPCAIILTSRVSVGWLAAIFQQSACPSARVARDLRTRINTMQNTTRLCSMNIWWIGSIASITS